MTAPKRIAHVTLLPYENDARVLRAIAATKAAGFECPVVAPGFGFAVPPFDAKHKIKLATLFGIAGRLGVGAAQKAFFAFDHHRHAVRALVDAKPDAIHAHDWDGLFVGARAARTLDVPFAYDSHELAAHMHTERRLWRATVAPLIAALEPSSARAAEFVIGVSDGHARALHSGLGLSQPPLTIRNIAETPALSSLPGRPQNAPLLLHYHGAIGQGRGIEEAIRALALVDPSVHLRLTGPWLQPGYREKMEAIADELGVADRMVIAPSVPHQQLVGHASEADIGLCMLTTGSRHNDIALPNKVFDYLKAGLPVIASGTSELGFAQNVDAAIDLSECSAEALADAVKNIKPDRLKAMRKSALALAQKNEWEGEASRLGLRWQAVFDTNKTTSSG